MIRWQLALLLLAVGLISIWLMVKVVNRDEFRLPQLLLQLGRKEEEESHPENRSDAPSARPTDPEMINYVAERLVKLRPSRRASLINAIAAMFQFQGSVSESDRDAIIVELQRRKHISIDANNRVTYL